MKVNVEILNGAMDGEKFDFDKSVITIGRGNEKDISLKFNVYISRNHAEIKVDKDKFWIIDTSRNGTYVGGKEIHHSRTEIPNDTVFVIGGENGTRLIINSKGKNEHKKKKEDIKEIRTEDV